MFILICYDIEDDKRRTRIRKTLRSYGEAVQESVFEAQLDDKQFHRLYARLASLLEREDNIRCYLLCESCVRRIQATHTVPKAKATKVHLF